MKTQYSCRLFQNPMSVGLYTSKQVYAIEQEWFAHGYDSFGLMQQAAWQMMQHIIKIYSQKQGSISEPVFCIDGNKKPRAHVWVGKGNNGGDGWLIALYLQQAGWQVKVITVGIGNLEKSRVSEGMDLAVISDSRKAQRMAVTAGCIYQRFEDSVFAISQQDMTAGSANEAVADIYIDALFGIGLERVPTGVYKQAIHSFNQFTKLNKILAVSVDIPSGLVATTGQVFEKIAIQADVTLCLLVRKVGLHIKDGMDYTGEVIDVPLIPYNLYQPTATLFNNAYCLSRRWNNSHKGSYGHVLVIGGNRIDGSQGMGGAAILASASAMATGAGKITVSCHEAFHGALLTSLPDAMTIDLHNQKGVKDLIKGASVVAIGMGLGRDDLAKELFINYVEAAITENKSIVIDADGLYHLASLKKANHSVVYQLYEYSKIYSVYLTPHSGEAARLLNKEIKDIEINRLSAIEECAKYYGGNWVLKGSGSLILEQKEGQAHIYVCGVGNAGMATAGMGDVLSGVIAGLLAQQDLDAQQSSLKQAVMIHGLAGDTLVKNKMSILNQESQLYIGKRGLQAQDMPAAIRHIMHILTM